MKCMQLMFYSRRHSPTVFFPAFVSYCIYSDYQNTEKFKQRKAELERILKNWSSMAPGNPRNIQLTPRGIPYKVQFPLMAGILAAGMYAEWWVANQESHRYGHWFTVSYPFPYFGQELLWWLRRGEEIMRLFEVTRQRFFFWLRPLWERGNRKQG